MRHLPRPRSRSFRATLALALLAWTALAFSAPALPMPMPASHAASAHAAPAEACDTAGMMPIAAHATHPPSAPALPAGHGDCCHAHCHCLAPLGVDVVLAPALGESVRPGSPVFVSASADPVVAMAAPPLRPPIA